MALSAVWITLLAILIILFFLGTSYFVNENSMLRNKGRNKCRCLYFVTNTRPDKKFVKPKDFLAWDIIDSRSLTNSSINCPSVLLVIRICVILYFCLEIYLQSMEFGSGFEEPAVRFLIYFTNWTFILFCLYGIIGTFISVKAMIEGYEEVNEFEFVPKPWTLLEKIFLLLLETVSSCSIFLTAFYWAVEYDPEVHGFYIDNLMRHGINVVVIILDITLSRVPYMSYHFFVVLVYPIIYLIFMWIYHEVSNKGEWVYSTLNTSETSSLAYYIILPLLIYLGFLIMACLAAIREILISKYKKKIVFNELTERLEDVRSSSDLKS